MGAAISCNDTRLTLLTMPSSVRAAANQLQYTNGIQRARVATVAVTPSRACELLVLYIEIRTGRP